MRSRLKLAVPLLALALAATGCTSSDNSDPEPVGSTGGNAAVGSYPRAETLYTTGTQYGPPSNWNPLMNWTYATGTVGLVYETLFLYDPQADKYQPWLAESGEWKDKTTYELKLRSGVTWTDGKPFTADDVVYTVQLCKLPSSTYSTLCTWLKSAEAVDKSTVKFTFSKANYQEWANWVYNNPILPAHLWKSRSENETTSGANDKPVGTGPYKYLTHSQDRQVWVKNDGWWGAEQLDVAPKPKYIVDIVNGSNNVALGLVLQGSVDLSNNFLPGVSKLLGKDSGYGLETYYDKPPYMLSANTAWLVTNNTKKPMDDPAFRRALAHAVDTQQIAKVVYGDMVAPADPTGLLPIWDKYVDKNVTRELGFSYDPAKARSILADAGYKNTDGNGMVANKDGSKIKLTLMVPNGWTDWMEAAKMIAQSAKAAGIDITTATPDYNSLVDSRNSGKFDLVINNDQQMSNTPWTYYNYVFRQPIAEQQTAGNFGRYSNAKAWKLVNELDATEVTDLEGMKGITSKLQRIQLTDMPIIPLWYNGLWSQYNNSVWTNWPSASGSNHYLPTTWRGYWQLDSILMLDQLKPAAAKK